MSEKEQTMINEEWLKACLYLLKHYYETESFTLDNDEEGKTYTSTPNTLPCFKTEITKQLIEEVFPPHPLKLEDLKKDMWIWDDKYKECRKIYKIYNAFDYQILLFRCDKNEEGAFFEDKRFYPINIQFVGG